MVKKTSVGRVLFLVAAVQFINITDFMMVMPLGPDFAKDLGIPSSHLGYIGGAYTMAASVVGLAGAFFLDRFDRRSVLGVCMAGLMLGTLAGGFATGLPSLLLARVIAGAFGGPASSISLAIISDVVPPAQRGKAMGVVMGAFSAASVLGVPLGLELSRVASWRMPFFVVAGLGLGITACTYALLPPIREHLDRARPRLPFSKLVSDPLVLLSLAVVGTVALSAFFVIPNFSAYFQFNAGYPRKSLGMLYLAGGAVSFFAMRVVGRLVDKLGSAIVLTVGSAGFIALVWLDVVIGVPLVVPPMLFFVLFMIFQPSRAIPANALGTRVPPPEGRASYQSLQSSVMHMACALGAMISARLLGERPDHALVNMDRVGTIAVVIAAFLPPMMFVLERAVRRREAAMHRTAADQEEEIAPVSIA